jgi:hypothetical protein
MQALRADTALSQQDPKCWSSKFNKALQELLGHNDMILQQEHTPVDNQHLFPAWRDRWQNRWLQYTDDPRSPDARNRETLTYAAWIKQGEGMQWKDLPAYLSGMGHDGWLDIVRFRLGNHGLAVETGRWSRSTYDQRFCMRCTQAGLEQQHVHDAHHFLLDCVTTRPLREAQHFQDIFDSCSGDIRSFLADTRSYSYLHLCMRKLAAAASTTQQGPAVQIWAGG